MSFWKCCGGAACPAVSARSSNISVRACDVLGAMDRHVIANMGAELGATTTVFPVRRGNPPFSAKLKAALPIGARLLPMLTAAMTMRIEIDLSDLEPLVATP